MRKENILFLAIAVMFFGFIAGVFFTQHKMLKYQTRVLNSKINRVHVKPVDKAHNLKVASGELIDKIEKLERKNESLLQNYEELLKENEKLKNELFSYTSPKDPLIPLKEKIKHISLMIDESNLNSAQTNKLSSLLQTIYKEVHTLEEYMTEYPQEISGYQEKLKESKNQLRKKMGELDVLKAKLTQIEEKMEAQKTENGKLREYREKYDDMLTQHRVLTKESFRDKEEVQKMSACLKNLEDEKNKYLRAAKENQEKLKNYEAQIAKFTKEKEKMNLKAIRCKKEINDLTQDLYSASKEKQCYVEEIKVLERKDSEHAAAIKKLNKELEHLANTLRRAGEEKNKVGDAYAELKKERDQLCRQREKSQEQAAQQTEQLRRDEEKLILLTKEIAATRKEYEHTIALYKEAEDERGAKVNFELAKRADKIVVLQGVVEEKDNTLAQVKDKLDEYMKELALLRENTLKVKLENARLLGELKNREAALIYLKQEVRKISEINSQFNQSLERVSNVIGEEKKSAEGEEGVSIASSESEEAKVIEVELESVSPQAQIEK